MTRCIQLITHQAAEHFGLYIAGDELFREVYAFYSPTYAGPSGNIANCFLVSDTSLNPTIQGVPVPDSANYTIRKEIEIDLSACSPRQFHGILGKLITIRQNSTQKCRFTNNRIDKNEIFSEPVLWLPTTSKTCTPTLRFFSPTGNAAPNVDF